MNNLFGLQILKNIYPTGCWTVLYHSHPPHPNNQRSQGKLKTIRTYHTEPTTLMKLSPAGFAMTWVDVVPVVMDVTMVERGMVITGSAWLRDICC